MIVKSDSLKSLIAVSDRKIHSIGSQVVRKPLDYASMKKKLKKESVCIVCDYRFKTRKLKFPSSVKAICHPFKDVSHFPKKIKKYLFSESDFCSNLLTPVDKTDLSSIPQIDGKKYDFVYFTLLSRQGINCKGLYLLPLIDMVSSELGLKGLVINYSTYTTKHHNNKVHNKLLKSIRSSWKKFDSLKCMSAKLTPKQVCAVMKNVNFVLFPNTADASPRMIAEALVRDKPVVVNSSIYGGWKYVTNDNGRFFDAPVLKDYFNSGQFNDNHISSLYTAMKDVLCLDQTKISNDFYSQYGFANSVQDLAQIINKITGKEYDAVAFKEWRKPLKKVAREKGWI